MSYIEAKRDGIRSEQVNGRTYYYPRCQFCGMEVRSWNYLPSYHYTCALCRPYKALLQKEAKKQ